MPLDISKATADAQGQISLNIEMEISLERGANNLHVEATNAGGLSRSKPLVVSFTYLPLRLLIDSLEPKNGAGPVLKPELSHNHWDFKDSVRSAVVRHTGRIEFPDASAAERAGKTFVRAVVNGFQQDHPRWLQSRPQTSPGMKGSLPRIWY